MLKLSNTAAKDSDRTGAPYNVQLDNRSRTSISLLIRFKKGTLPYSLVLAKSGALMDFNARPIDGVSYTANNTFGAGAMIGNGYIVNNEVQSSQTYYADYDYYSLKTISGMAANTSYSFVVYLYDPATLKYSMGVKFTAKTTI